MTPVEALKYVHPLSIIHGRSLTEDSLLRSPSLPPSPLSLPPSFPPLLPPSLTHSLPPSLPPSLPSSLAPSLTPSLLFFPLLASISLQTRLSWASPLWDYLEQELLHIVVDLQFWGSKVKLLVRFKLAQCPLGYFKSPTVSTIEEVC